MTRDTTTFTDAQREALAAALETTWVAGHTQCEHFQAMKACLDTFASHGFNIEDAAIVWLMLFVEAVLMMPNEFRPRFASDIITQIHALTKATDGLPQINHEQQAASDLH